MHSKIQYVNMIRTPEIHSSHPRFSLNMGYRVWKFQDKMWTKSKIGNLTVKPVMYCCLCRLDVWFTSFLTHSNCNILCLLFLCWSTYNFLFSKFDTWKKLSSELLNTVESFNAALGERNEYNIAQFAYRLKE